MNGKIAVEKVGSIPEKLDLVLRERQGGILKNEKSYLFYTPIGYLKSDGSLCNVIGLPQVGELKKLKIEVIPVATLNEIVDRLNLLPLIPSWYLRLAALASLGLVLIGLASYIYYSLNQPVPLKWVEKEPNFGFGEQPFSRCEIDNLNFYYPIKRGEGNYIVYVLKTRNGKQDYLSGFVQLSPNGLANFWNTYYVSYIDVDAYSSNPESLIIRPLKQLKGIWQIHEPLYNVESSANLLFVLVTEQPPAPILHKIGKDITKRYSSLPLNLDLLVNELAELSVANPLFFKYKTVLNNHRLKHGGFKLSTESRDTRRLNDVF